MPSSWAERRDRTESHDAESNFAAALKLRPETNTEPKGAESVEWAESGFQAPSRLRAAVKKGKKLTTESASRPAKLNPAGSIAKHQGSTCSTGTGVPNERRTSK